MAPTFFQTWTEGAATPEQLGKSLGGSVDGVLAEYVVLDAEGLGARVIITSSQDEKLERAKALGAEGTVNYKKHSDWEEKVLDLTGGKGVDHVLEVGGAQTLPKSARATPTSARW